ncbi:hypothetical protein NL676_015822 [Syzygium grande]|nr:hypothetical protein NL676_015822 [Syzygium grande]
MATGGGIEGGSKVDECLGWLDSQPCRSFGSIRLFNLQTIARIRPICRSLFRSGGDGDLDLAFVLCFPRPKASKISPPRKAAYERVDLIQN